MTRTSSKLSLLSFPLFLLACVSEVGDDEGEGGMMNTALPGTGASSMGAGVGTGASDPGSTGGATATGGVGSGGDLLAKGGAGAGGVIPATGGMGTGGGTGGDNAGTGGEVAGTGGESSALANPSPGCSAGSSRPESGRVYEAGVSWLVFPEKYDGTTPLPVLFGFHGCGSGNFGDENRTEFYDLTRNSGFETDYVVALPLATSGSCYDYNTDVPKAKALYDELVNNYCVDLDRVFATGHSSGAGLVTNFLTPDHAGDFAHFNFRGIAPVAAWDMSINTSVPTMYIQGVTDSERSGGDGKNVVDKIVAANSCSQDTTPYAVDSCNSSHDGASVNAGCVSYGSCSAETIWCSHDDSAYGGTFHGVPCFYRQAVFDFFESL